MLENSFGLLFFLKASRRSACLLKYVYLRITVDGVAKELSTKMQWLPDRWDQGTGRAVGNREDARVLNQYIEALSSRIYQIRTGLLQADSVITAVRIRNILTGRDLVRPSLLTAFRRHNDQMTQLLGKEYAKATLTRFETALAHTSAFISWKYNRDDLELRELDYAFVKDFEFFLKSLRHCAHNSAMKYIANVKKIVLQCLMQGWLSRNPFLGFKMKLQEVRRHPLNAQELQTLISTPLASERLSQVRDVFLFSCYTGLAWIDVKQLTPFQIAPGIDGEQWLITDRQKTDSPTRLPLLPEAVEILLKYRNHAKCRKEGRALPVLSNQKMNLYLKEIARICALNKRLTFHIARHTFATTLTLSNGVPLNTVSKMLGHKSIQQTEHYAKLNDRMISEDMARLRERLNFQQQTMNPILSN